MNEQLPSKETVPDEPKDLPLWKAALTWCDPVRVQNLLSAHHEYALILGQPVRNNPFPMKFDIGLLGNMVVATWARNDGEPKMAAATKWTGYAAAVEADFRRRVATGEVRLTGLQTLPQLRDKRSIIPKDWAALLSFKWSENAVIIKGTVFSGIVCQSGPAATTGRIGEAKDATKSRGRPGFPMNEMVTLAVERLQMREQSNQLEATKLLILFKERYPGQQTPAHRTVINHLRRIYALAIERARKVNPLNPF